jgi:hypothetical protein
MRILIVISILTVLGCSTTTKQSDKNAPNPNTQNKEEKVPSLTMPKVRKVWVPDKIESDKYIEGHWMWVLERTSTWSQ